jgi:glycosyltransferase involved in cell wall biosynthesis
MKNNKKLLIVLYYYYPYVSGLSIYAKRIADGLVKKGVKVTVLTSRYKKGLLKREVVDGVEVLRRPVLFKLGKGVIMPTLPMDIILGGRDYDFVNPMLPMAEIGPILLFVPKKKIIVSYICDLFLGNKLLPKIITFLSSASMHLAMMRAKEIFALSFDYLSNSKMKKYQTKATAVYPIIDSDEFKPMRDWSGFYTSSLGIGKPTKKIGFVGRIVYEKGVKYLLESIESIDKGLADFKIIIVGDYKNIAGGSVKKELDFYVNKYPNKIIFTGYLNDDDLKRFYSGLDVLVLPSIDPLEAFGMVQVESMLCGTPVVASDLPGVREVVQKTGFGLLSRVKDPEDIANKILEVIKNRDKYVPSRKKIITIFNPEYSLDPYLDKMR